MKNIPLLLITIVGTLALIVAVAALFSRSTSQAMNADPATVQGEARNVKGAAQAPIVITEFSDFQCPACKATQPLLAQMVTQYPDQVKIIYRHYPLTTIHLNAQLAAQAAEAAADQGKFWEMHDLLFANQETWAVLKSEEEVQAQFEQYAEQLGIDKQKFHETIGSQAIKDRVARDITDGNILKVSATPTLYLNGRKVPAPQQLPSLIESELQQVTQGQ